MLTMDVTILQNLEEESHLKQSATVANDDDAMAQGGEDEGGLDFEEGKQEEEQKDNGADPNKGYSRVRVPGTDLVGGLQEVM